MPVVVIAPNDALLEKVKSNMQEVKARGGILFVFADSDSHFVETKGIKVIRAPRHSGIPISYYPYYSSSIACLSCCFKKRNRCR
jgi:glucosamine 6-phosphate synthetase-like amidotransferase/phosphosugar isomerase protein